MLVTLLEKVILDIGPMHQSYTLILSLTFSLGEVLVENCLTKAISDICERVLLGRSCGGNFFSFSN